MYSILTNGINNIIKAIPENERNIFVCMLDSFNPYESIDKTYLIPIELYCDICNIPYRGYEENNIKQSLMNIDISITQNKDGCIAINNDINGYHWSILNKLEIRINDDVIAYSFHKRLYPYIIAYHIMKQGGI